jgi:hypothetical protein
MGLVLAALPGGFHLYDAAATPLVDIPGRYNKPGPEGAAAGHTPT